MTIFKIKIMHVVAPCPEGLENLLAEEILQFGGKDIKVFKRYVSFSCENETFYRLHFFSRIAFRFYRQISNFICFDKYDLYRGVQSSFDWPNWLPPNKSFCVTVSGTNSNLRHTHFTALQVKNAIVDLQKATFGKRSNISLDTPYISIHLHIYKGEASLSLQSTLGSLHKRGYRPALGYAPIKENLAAGLIKYTDWDGKRPLIDLMCGSGTFLIEGLSQVLNIPTPLQKKYLFENWVDFDVDIFLHEKSKLLYKLPEKKLIPSIVGCDCDKKIINQAKTNIALAGFENYIDAKYCDFSELRTDTINDIGIILCNPPYGKKIGKDDALEELYTRLGIFLKERFSQWEFWLLSGNPSLTKYLKMKSTLKIPVSNGGIDCRWIKYLIR